MQIARILCPVDTSETSANALRYGAMLSQWYGAPLTVLEMIWMGFTVIPPGSDVPILGPLPRAACASELEGFVQSHLTPGGARPETVLREGPIVAGILDEARARAVDLIVMGTHGRGGFDRFVLGSVTEKVLRKATCPVLTVPPAAVSAPASPRPFRAILCAVDFSPASLKAVEYGISLALESGKRLVLLHVLDSPNDHPTPPGRAIETRIGRRHHEEAAQAELDHLLPDDARQWCECSRLTAIGRPYEEILKAAASTQADLIVLGVHGRANAEFGSFGSTTNQLVRHATCPVLTVRP